MLGCYDYPSPVFAAVDASRKDQALLMSDRSVDLVIVRFQIGRSVPH